MKFLIKFEVHNHCMTIINLPVEALHKLVVKLNFQTYFYLCTLLLTIPEGGSKRFFFPAQETKKNLKWRSEPRKTASRELSVV